MPKETTWTRKKKEKFEANFTRGRLVIVDFLVRLMTLLKDHAPSKSPFDQSPPHPPGFTAGE
jgi:hypothetical protein